MKYYLDVVILRMPILLMKIAIGQLQKNWAQWWARCDHLKMLSKFFSAMTIDQWQACPSSTNAVERRNKDCKSDSPQCLKLSMIKVYKIDKLACLKHIAA